MDYHAAKMEEYKTLRDETLRRIDSRNQTVSYTLAFAAAMFTLGLGKEGFSAALLVYPIVALFFATAFSHSSLMLIQIGAHLRLIEKEISGLQWATSLRPKYVYIEIFELISVVGLFIGTECIGIFLYHALPLEDHTSPTALYWVSIAATAFTIVSCFYPWFYHRTLQKVV